jgi:hypothetical protein
VTRTLLSSGFGVPIALLAMLLLFRLEMFTVTRRLRPALMRTSAALVIGVLLVLIIARFAKYS